MICADSRLWFTLYSFWFILLYFFWFILFCLVFLVYSTVYSFLFTLLSTLYGLFYSTTLLALFVAQPACYGRLYLTKSFIAFCRCYLLMYILAAADFIIILCSKSGTYYLFHYIIYFLNHVRTYN